MQKQESDSPGLVRQEQRSAVRQLGALVHNPSYVFTTMALSALFFVISGIQMWVSDYLGEVLEVPQATVVMAFAIVCITAPVLGAVLSGVVASNFGGYTSPHAMPAVIVAALMALAVALPVPYVDSFRLVAALIWLLLFLGAFIMPILTGVMLHTVDVNDRPQANAVANLCYNLFGFVPSPVIYGAVCSAFGGRQSRAGMKVLMSMTVVNFFFICCGHLALLKARREKAAAKHIGALPLGRKATQDFYTAPAQEECLKPVNAQKKTAANKDQLLK